MCVPARCCRYIVVFFAGPTQFRWFRPHCCSSSTPSKVSSEGSALAAASSVPLLSFTSSLQPAASPPVQSLASSAATSCFTLSSTDVFSDQHADAVNGHRAFRQPNTRTSPGPTTSTGKNRCAAEHRSGDDLARRRRKMGQPQPRRGQHRGGRAPFQGSLRTQPAALHTRLPPLFRSLPRKLCRSGPPPGQPDAAARRAGAQWPKLPRATLH